MRFIEPEGRSVAYVIVIFVLILLYFGCYIVGAIFLLSILPLWLFFCSSKIITPSMPNAIVAPISGIIKEIEVSQNEIKFHISPRFNGRIYSPNDLQNIHITHTFGFFNFGFNDFTKMLNARDILSATSNLDGVTLNVEMYLTPYIFRFCGLKFSGKNALFLEKIGFLNLGVLTLSVKGKNLQSLARANDKIVGGNTALVVVKKD
ncbi:hypothetical protein DCO58_10780 [Helicobacter saguini]|uniref:Phosphatidylserine decarboxylase n=1 Tax=Helicobacter saguini TaxID=1548018 RepID=A0A347VPT8_9HELI|nr:hypothetical protein [Helicobacter saguini]MWV61217.1 hypothetical protein [Helicobacter saguini]MWV68116.1 hypothetical protein [Helicobacter saguini]MWV70420.1 hypothetical protein [Helicobacter saguini]MWV72321.1 hypothetical protein [Helicobacter saguini]TLD92976.1 hypothetical protein LS64_009255 [Helicobacter saguini]